MESTPLDPVRALADQARAMQQETTEPTRDLGRDDFLMLLVAKLENQDPLNPSEDTQFLSELATYSSLEQLLTVNANLENLAIGQAQLLNAQALTLIGKEALVEAGGKLSVRGGRPDTIVYAVPSPAQEATLSIKNAAGDTVKTFELDKTPRGRITLDWDGTDSAGKPLPDGEYTLHIQARDVNGDPLAVALFKSLSIDGVNLAGGFIQLISGDVEISVDSILEFRAGRD